MSTAVKIAVTPEGREGVWIPEVDSLTAWIVAQDFDQIHNMIDSGFALIGADHDVDSVLGDICGANPGEVAILTGGARAGNMGHALAIISGNRLRMYDLGDVTEDDLSVQGL